MIGEFGSTDLNSIALSQDVFSRADAPVIEEDTVSTLIVDDEVHNSGVLEYVLKFHDAKVRIADSGAECLKQIEKEAPTLILLDLSMPKMSG